MGQEFQLLPGSSSVQLADHVGHQVEVTGTFGSPSASPSSGTTTGTTGSPSGTGTSSATPGRPGSTQPGQATSPSASNMATTSSLQRDVGADALGKLPAVTPSFPSAADDAALGLGRVEVSMRET